MLYPEPLSKLIDEFKRMPGIGPKSAQRLALYMMNLSSSEVEKFIKSVRDVKDRIKYCSICFNLTVEDPCAICRDPNRNRSLLCVVAEPKDLIAVERTGEYKGLYHVLGGVISPIDGVGPDDLKIKELLKRLEKGVSEVILATNPTTEGEATVIYLTKLLKPLGVKITRLAYGLPVGADLDFTDEVTLSKAFEGRREMN